MVTDTGKPVELTFAPGSTADIEMLREMPLELSSNSALIGDKGFLDRGLENGMLTFIYWCRVVKT